MSATLPLSEVQFLCRERVTRFDGLGGEMLKIGFRLSSPWMIAYALA